MASCGVGFVATKKWIKEREVVIMGLNALKKLTHRGGLSSDLKTGDGAGILTEIPFEFFNQFVEGNYGVGTLFMPRNLSEVDKIHSIIEAIITKMGSEVISYRAVPVNTSIIGEFAFSTMPYIEHVFIKNPSMEEDKFEKFLYAARRAIQNAVLKEGIYSFHIPSFSSRTIVYKGLIKGSDFDVFYPDLLDENFKSRFIVFHQRYATNTYPDWKLAQPFRTLAHNGEINTLEGNRSSFRSKDVPEFEFTLYGSTIEEGGSDSLSLDNVLELLINKGVDVTQAISMLIPPAWDSDLIQMDEKIRAMYMYFQSLIEPWDGPAAVVFTDGKKLGAILDRNGLRPFRYIETKNYIVAGSEIGLIEFPFDNIVYSGKLNSGELLLVEEGKILKDENIKTALSRNKPYSIWISKNTIEVPEKEPETRFIDLNDVKKRMKLYGVTGEYESLILKTMANGNEPIGSMGDDTPPAVLSKKPKKLYSYFKQCFAQVTNPPIDHMRERIVTSLRVMLGRRNPPWLINEYAARLIHLKHPVMLLEEFNELVKITQEFAAFKSVQISATFNVNEGASGLEKAVIDIREKVYKLVKEYGYSIVVLSDRDVDENNAPIPMLLATSAVHSYLVRKKVRHLCSIIALTDEAVETHEVAALFAFGANAVVPLLGFDIIRKISMEHNLDASSSIKNYRNKLEDGILKVMSKMGISVLESYIGSMLMDAVGISRGVIERFFTNSTSKVSGIKLDKIREAVLARHSEAFKPQIIIEHGGEFVYRTNGEYHAFNPEVVKALQKAATDINAYKEFDTLIHTRPLCSFRDLFEFKKLNPIPIEEVEPVSDILKRFVISGMSFGALSIETHTLLAQAANELGMKSNSGEGGEIPERFNTPKNSKIKQVASGRFGVTAEYLLSAEEIEIKMAQGSKPGEGGHLPGEKVSPEIAKARRSQIGISLISPPPHHDIYSIEDLAQLIYDLKRINPEALVAVKLVSGRGVGTIACGVAKGFADVIQISGCEGGTGASPLSSIKNAGLPVEFGVAETQRALVVNNLRKMVKIRVDGGIKCGRDVVMLAMLGAEEFGFGTSVLVASGCLMARQCHRNTCPAGVATQNPELRKKFQNKVERVKNYLMAVAEETRTILAELGFKSLKDIIGNTSLLKPKEEYKNMFDFGALILQSHTDIPHSSKVTRNEPEHISRLDEELLKQLKTIDENTEIEIYSEIKNTDRSIGAYLSGHILKNNRNFKGKIKVNFTGYAGQSFGAFLIDGVEFKLNGIANDYVGKGLSGGSIIIKLGETEDFVLAGNACIYGATKGKLFIRGFAGERFAVRNSGVVTVIHGCADHGCEYMTGGVVVVLKKIGKNFASGMTGGVVYILQKKEEILRNLNPHYTEIKDIGDDDFLFLKNLLLEFIEKTESKTAASAIKSIDSFYKVVPKETVLKKVKT